jgi:hypothetical protein
MRRWRWAVLALCVCGLVPGRAPAGVYNPGASEEDAIYPNFLGTQGRNFRDVLITLRSIGADTVQFDNPVRRRYLLEAELASRTALNGLKSVEDKLQVSAVLIRRRKAEDAILLLKPLSLQHRDNFLVQSNLATAYHLNKELDNAFITLDGALREQWPEHWDQLSEPQREFLTRLGWNEGPFTHYRTCDKYYARLLRLRR